MKEKIKLIHLTVMFFMALLALIIVFVELFFDLTALQKSILTKTTYGILFVFFVEFVVMFAVSEDKKAFLKGNWISLLVLIPPIKAIKALKIFKVIKGMKVVKTVKIGKKLKKAKDRYDSKGMGQ